MSDALIKATTGILCPNCHGRGVRTWPADTDVCWTCRGSGIQHGVRAGAAIRALAEEVARLQDSAVQLEAARDRLAEARGFLAVHAIPALECDDTMTEVVAEMRVWLDVSDG